MIRRSRSSRRVLPLPSEADYVDDVLALYTSLPHTPNRPRERDRVFAVWLFQKSFPFAVVRRGLLLASLRRLCRDPSARPLQVIRTLRYFEGAIVETLAEPTDDAYVRYLETKLRKAHPPPSAPAMPRPATGSRYVQLPLPF